MAEFSSSRVRARANKILPSLSRIAKHVRKSRLEAMGEADLHAFKLQVDEAIAARMREALEAASADLRRQAEDLGLTPAEIAAFATDRRRRPSLSA